MNNLQEQLQSSKYKVSFKENLLQLLAKYPSVDKNAMGFSQDWQELAIWRGYE